MFTYYHCNGGAPTGKMFIKHGRAIEADIIGVTRGGAPAPPRTVKKNIRPNLQEKCVSAPPQDTKCTVYQPEQESICKSFWFLLGSLDLEIYLDGDD